jgi:5-formyltetrahydrofolate cyclo-ligase
MSINTPDTERLKLRRELKTRRRNLSQATIRNSSSAVAKNLWHSGVLARTFNLAVYLAMPCEIDCLQIIKGARLRKMRIFAPILSNQKLLFAPLQKHSKLYKNRFDIAEPAAPVTKYVQPAYMDAVIVPLLGFDNAGNRIGMGGGFYDRSFAFRKRRGSWRRPLLIGVAYGFQQVEQIPTASWDIPLDIVITEQKILKNS